MPQLPFRAALERLGHLQSEMIMTHCKVEA